VQIILNFEEMKYIFRFIAVLPATTVLFTALICLILSFEYHILIVPTILQFIAGIILLNHYEETVINLINFLKTLKNEKA
jgi:hypothetical protein